MKKKLTTILMLMTLSLVAFSASMAIAQDDDLDTDSSYVSDEMESSDMSTEAPQPAKETQMDESETVDGDME